MHKLYTGGNERKPNYSTAPRGHQAESAREGVPIQARSVYNTRLYEAHLPTLQAQARVHPRIPGANVHPRRAGRPCPPEKKGAHAPHRQRLTAQTRGTPGRGDHPIRDRKQLRKEHGRFISLALEERPRSRRGSGRVRRPGRIRLEVRAPRQIFRRAVDRNRLRRQIREGLRPLDLLKRLEGRVLVVSARPAARGADTRLIWEDLERLVKRCGL